PPPGGSPGWAPRSDSRPGSFTRAGRSGSASCARSSTSLRAPARSGRSATSREGPLAGLRHGILGGAFNPPHIGHLVLAQEALVRLELDVVTLMPMGRAPHREIRDDPGPEVRVELCEAAVAGDDRFRVSTLETE